MYRRQLLAAVVTLGLAGCTGDDGGARASPTVTPTGSPTTTPRSSSPTPATGTRTTATRTDGTTGTDGTDAHLDLREANVTAVEFERDGRTVGFDVTLYHDDEGEDGYANWWQVEKLDGERLGRRELLHAHGTLEFTRSTDVEIPEGVSCVVVRGHDETHGYGGQAMLVNLETGATNAKRQGEDRVEFTASDCP